jgi:hypothetical protein
LVVLSGSHAGAEKTAKMPLRVGASLNQDQGLSKMTDAAFSALVRAWATTMIAMSLFVAALTLASAWDSSTYLQGLQDALNLDL